MEALVLAKQYFQLSNEQDLDTIESLFLNTSTYSSGQGLFFGKLDIMRMMRTFFESHQSLHWTIEATKELTPHIAEIEFSFLGQSAEGEKIQRRGLERIVVHNDSIQHIEVRPLP